MLLLKPAAVGPMITDPLRGLHTLRQIRVLWERYEGFARPLRDFLWDGASESVKDFMRATWGNDEA